MQVVYSINGALLLVLTFTYLGSVVYLINYLSDAYPRLWKELGAPRFDPNWARGNCTEFLQSFVRLFRFIISDKYKSLNDRKLSNLVLIARGALALMIFLFIYQIGLGLALRQ